VHSRGFNLIVGVCLVFSALPMRAADAVPARGRALFQACEYKKAARVFEEAISEQPSNAALHFWLGKSYARLAELSSPFTAPANARKASGHLEQAVHLDGRNREYRDELFQFYVDSPEWFRGGLQRAEALAERTAPESPDRVVLLEQLADSRAAHSGPAWRIRGAELWASGAVGRILP